MSRIQNISWILLVCFSSITGIVVFALLGYFIPVIILSAISIAMIMLQLINWKRDLSVIKQEADELKKTLEKREKIIADFSHKIRTPLNNFSIIIDLLNETSPDDHQKELLDTLLASTSNMITAMNDLTVNSAREISFEQRKSINFNLATTLQNTVELFNLKSGNNLLINLVTASDKTSQLRGDPIALKQIFLDILNELDTRKSDELELDIRFTVDPAAKGTHRVNFELEASRPIRFFKYNPENPVSSDSLAVKLILLLGGNIILTEGESRFLRFSVLLQKPVEEIKMSEAALRIRELKSEIKEMKKLSEANILLVEDNPTNQKIVMISLSSRVKNIDTAGNGKEALDLFGKSNYDLILMDVQLPVMDGITAVQKIRELEASTSKHTPVIAITANAMLGDKEKCLSAGMDEYLSKPFHPNQLLDLIRKHISG